MCSRVSSVFRAALEAFAAEQKLGLGSLGLLWVKIGCVKPSGGRELDNPALAEALGSETRFSQEDLERFEIVGLRMDDFIKSGDFYFQPASRHAVVNQQQDDELLDDRFDTIWACAQNRTPVSWFALGDMCVFMCVHLSVCARTRACMPSVRIVIY